MQQKTLRVKRSQLPNSGKGLFTTVNIKKGVLIIEYRGIVTTWKAIEQASNFNGYVFYINRTHVIDAKPYKHFMGRYANDAKGLYQIKGIRNNCNFSVIDNRVFIKALRNITAGEELFVGYGKEYWEVVKYNENLQVNITGKVS